jgi:glycosyltransferase involved in cell wall biosynthesis
VKTICFDLRALQIGHENRGIGMYIKSLLEHIPTTDNKYIFYAYDTSDPIKELGINFANNYELIQTTYIKNAIDSPGDFFNLIKLVSHTFQPLKSSKPDVFVQFDFTLGIPRWGRTKKIVIAYDLIPLIKQNEYLPTIRFAWHHSAGRKAKLVGIMRSMYYRGKFHFHYKVYKKADQIISISQATTNSYIDLLGISKHKIHTILLAPVLSDNKVDYAITNRINKPFIFYIGGTDSRKRIQDIIYAFNIVRGRGDEIALVLAGNEFRTLKQLPNNEGRNAITNSPYNKDIHLVGFVTDEQKLGLYQKARAFVFCSMFEGFGLPIVEAMQAGCPVISYNNSSIPEVSGDAAILVETGDYCAVAKNVTKLKDPVLRDKIITAGVSKVKMFNWQITVKKMLNVILSTP